MFTQYRTARPQLIESVSLALVLVATAKTIASNCLTISNSRQSVATPGGSTLTEVVELEIAFWNYWDGNNGEVMQTLVDR